MRSTVPTLHLASGLLAVAVAVAVVGVVGASDAAADDFPTVKLTDAGPDRPIPIGSSFYVQGSAAPEVARAQIAVLRTGRASLFHRPQVSCAAIIKDLPTINVADLPLGTSTVGELFPGATGHRDDDVLISPAWARGTLKDRQDFKLLVAESPTFFQAGFVYCLYVLESRAVVNDQTIAGLLEHLGMALAACSDSTCEAKADSEFSTSLRNALEAVDEKEAAALAASAIAEVGPVSEFFKARKRFVDGPSWLVPPPLRNQPARWLRIDLPVSGKKAAASDICLGDAPAQDLAFYLANRLTATPRGLIARASPASGGTAARLAKDVSDGTYEVKQLKILDDRLTIHVAGDLIDKAHPAKPLEAKTSDVRVAADVSVLDLLLLADERIVVDKREWTLKELRQKIAVVGLGAAPEDLKLVTAAAARLRQLVDGLSAVKEDTALADASSADSLGEIASHLQAWVACHLRPDELQALANDLQAMVDQGAGWADRKAGLGSTTVRTEPRRTIAKAPIRFNQRSWVFSYLTPVVGYASLEDSFTTSFAGVQLHFWPNPVDEPLWSHGRSDWRRAFALEVALAPKVASFGPDNRYTGISGSIPPLFIGFALHPLPYTSISGGRVVLGKRASALPAEEPQLDCQWYLGLSVQANIPDLVHQLTTPTATVAVEKK
jgi:hypothetical protein